MGGRVSVTDAAEPRAVCVEAAAVAGLGELAILYRRIQGRLVVVTVRLPGAAAAGLGIAKDAGVGAVGELAVRDLGLIVAFSP